MPRIAIGEQRRYIPWGKNPDIPLYMYFFSIITVNNPQPAHQKPSSYSLTGGYSQHWHRVVVPARQPMWPGRPVRQPFICRCWLYHPQSRTMKSATAFSLMCEWAVINDSSPISSLKKCFLTSQSGFLQNLRLWQPSMYLPFIIWVWYFLHCPTHDKADWIAASCYIFVWDERYFRFARMVSSLPNPPSPLSPFIPTSP
jgi:hypothetical protein